MTVERSYLQQLLALSEAAYTDSIPAGYSLTSRIVADPQASTALLETSKLDFGFVALADGVTYIVFRGTQDPQEWADDAYALLVKHWHTGLVHKGFSDVWQALYPCLETVGGAVVTIVGHSLGAALATLCAGSQLMAGRAVDLVTFAGPRVGDDAFADFIQASTRDHLRIVNSRDIVTHVPARPLFSHAGGTVTFHGSSLDWKTAHSEQLTYGPAIAALPAEIETETNQR